MPGARDRADSLRALLIHKGTKQEIRHIIIITSLRALLIHKGTKHNHH